MNIDKAIAEQEELLALLPKVFLTRYTASTKLGIEALKALPSYRNKLRHPERWLLPGETEE